MAMPPRSVKRRGASQRWLAVPLVLTMLVLLADASMHARSNQAQVTLSSDGWVDKVLPQLATSSAEGREIANLSTSPLREGSRPAADQLAEVARAAGATYKAASASAPPAKLEAAAALLDVCLSARAKGAAQMSGAVQSLLRTGKRSEAAAVASMAGAVSDFAVSDNAYQLFAQDMTRLGFSVPSSAWDLGAAHYGTKGFDAFAARLLAGQTHLAPHQLTVDAISTNPVALSEQGKVQILPPSSAMSVTIVVSDTGSSPERGVSVSATITPAKDGPSQSRSATIDLASGGSQSVVLGGFVMAVSTSTVLKVTATEPGGEPGSTSRALSIEMAGGNFGASTTTAGATTSTLGGATTTTAGAPATTTATTTAATTTTETAATTSVPPVTTTTVGTPPATTTTAGG